MLGGCFRRLLEVSCKKRCSYKFCKIHKETPGLRLATLLKETLIQVLSCKFRQICKNTFFTEHLRATASVLTTLQKSTIIDV